MRRYFRNGSLNIAQKLLIVTANNDSFNEGSNPNSLTASYSGFVPGETLATSGVSGAPSLTTAATSTSAPGTSYLFTVGVGTLQAVNYYFQTQNGSLTVVDVAPTILMSIGPITLNLGDGFTRPGAFTDPGSVVLPLLTETWTITVDYGDGTTPVTTTATTPGSVSIDHVYGSVSGVNPYTVTIKIGDNFGASSTKTFTVTVNVP